MPADPVQIAFPWSADEDRERFPPELCRGACRDTPIDAIRVGG
jgi:hypothetical protein